MNISFLEHKYIFESWDLAYSENLKKINKPLKP